MARVLLIDDDTELCDMLAAYLGMEGFEVGCAYDGDTGLAAARNGGIDAVVLDVMMPRRNGFDVLRELRTTSDVPVLMLTARDEDVDSIVGLELGADDYLGKPCNPRVLVARIRAVLRRTERPEAGAEGQPDSLQVADLELHAASRTVLRGGRPLAMTSTEFSVLEVLMRDAGRAVAKGDLSERALGRRLTPFDRNLDMHVSNLRRKIGPLPDGGERIKTVRGVGYQMVVPSP